MKTISVYSIYPICKKRNVKIKYQQIIKSLSKHPRLKTVIDLVGPLKYKIPIWDNIDDAVLYAVVGQMLSINATKSIIDNLLSKFKTSSKVFEWANYSRRQKGPLLGLSYRKRKALNEWYRYKNKNKMLLIKLKNMPSNECRKELTTIWGIGRWSADIISIFHLGKMDIWPINDLGINKACKILFRTTDYKIFQKFIKPSETIVALYLWQLIDKGLLNKVDSI